ncbi:MAG: hypothetical protein INR71_02845 [Terriglobus roseus]|nr:hypothetical protein [Terriglobus roseus]
MSKATYTEALPRLYEHRTFQAASFRTFGTQHEAILERWWIMDRFLASLSEEARDYVSVIRVPMLLSYYDQYGYLDAFRSFESRLRRLRKVELEAVTSTVMIAGDELEDETDEEATSALLLAAGNDYRLYPAMAFSKADVELFLGDRQGNHGCYSKAGVAKLQDLFRHRIQAMKAKRATRQNKAQAAMAEDEVGSALQQLGLE